MAKLPKSIDTDTTCAPARPRTSLLERVGAFLDAKEWRYESCSDKGYLDLRAEIGDTSVRVIMDVYEADDWERLLVYSIYPVRIPEGRRLAVLEAINQINFRLVYGNFDMDGRDGEVRVRTVVEAEADLAEALMERVLHSNLTTADRHFAPLMAVAFGNADPASVMDLTPKAASETVH